MILRKKQDNLPYILMYKKPALCVTRFFIEFLKFAKGGGHLLIKKTMHFVLYFYIEKQYTLCYVDRNKEHDTMRYILISRKQCTFRYLYIQIIYRVVLIPNFKRTYDQIDQIEK